MAWKIKNVLLTNGEKIENAMLLGWGAPFNNFITLQLPSGKTVCINTDKVSAMEVDEGDE